MKINTLKRSRKIIPGVFILVGLVPFYFLFRAELPFAAVNMLGIPILLGIAWLLGSAYQQVGLRESYNGESHWEIIQNIKTQLWNAGRTTAIPNSRKEEIFEARALLNIFYSFVDNDPTLQQKSVNVRDNGLSWSTWADLVVIGSLYALMYSLMLVIAVLFFPQHQISMFLSTIVCLFAVLIGQFLHRKAVKRHIELGDEQLEFLIQNYLTELQRKVNAL